MISLTANLCSPDWVMSSWLSGWPGVTDDGRLSPGSGSDRRREPEPDTPGQLLVTTSSRPLRGRGRGYVVTNC